MFRSRKHKNKRREKNHSKSSKHSAASSISSPTATEPFPDFASIQHEPQAQWTKHISRSLLSLPLSSSSARQSLSPTSDVLHSFTFDLPPPPPRSMSYTSSPISPVAPILPPIPRVSAVSFLDEDAESEQDRTSSPPADDAWKQTSQSSRRVERSSLDTAEEPSISDRAGISLPVRAARFTTTSPNGVAHDSLSDIEVRKRQQLDNAKQWPLSPSDSMDFEGRPQTAPREPTTRSGTPHNRARVEGRFNSVGGLSPIYSRPMTSASSHRAIASPSQHSFDHDGSRPNSRASNLSPLARSVNMFGPVAQNFPPSRSNFPSESHRLPPNPPGSSLSSSVPPTFPTSTYTHRHTGETQAPSPAIQTVQITKKNKLSLLNPVNLLLRRRSPNPIATLSQDSSNANNSSTTYPGLPLDYDPRIRGKIVHDFSTPKDRRAEVVSPHSFRSSASAERSSHDDHRIDRDRVPAFKEHFDDSESNANAAVRAEQLENKEFLARHAALAELSVSSTPPPFGRPKGFSNPTARPLTIDTTFATLQPPPAQDDPSLSPVVEESGSTAPKAASVTTPAASADSTPKRQSAIHRRTTAAVKKRSRRVSAASRMSRSSIASDASFSSVTVPSHSNSKSSRFSFQLAGKDSILQEQMLEERHKQKEAARKLAEGDDPDVQELDDAEDDYNYEDDMAYMEEEVPTVGDGWGFDDSQTAVGLGNMTLDDMRSSPPPNLAQLALKGNPVNVEELHRSSAQGLGIFGNNDQNDVHIGAQGQQFSGLGAGFVDGGLDDDLYFDDGMIDEVNFDESEQFDESVLDDPSHPLYERRPKKADDSQKMLPTVLIKDAEAVEDQSAFESNVTVLNFNQSNTNATPQAMADYHNILAMAAMKAAEAGRFERQNNSALSSSTSGANTTRAGSTQPSLVQDDSQSSRASQSSPQNVAKVDSAVQLIGSRALQSPDSFALGSGYDTFESNYASYGSELVDYDSALEDDPIIAAANADALANDDDGIYGSEFGFYAKPDTEAEGVFQDGGYFGPKEWSDIKRQKSTREPNLTPITERSEFSTRNSFIHVPSSDKDRSQSGLGLAQLKRMSPHGWDGDMNMEALMKLRRGAFGGSQASLGSHGSNREIPSSPLASSPIAGIWEARSSAQSKEKNNSVLPSRSSLSTPVFATVGKESNSEEDDQDWEDASSAEESDYTSTEEVDDDDDKDSDAADDFTHHASYGNNTVRADPQGKPIAASSPILPSSPPLFKHVSSSSPLSARSRHSPAISHQSTPFIFPGPGPTSQPDPQAHAKMNNPALVVAGGGGDAGGGGHHSRSGSDTVAYVQEQDAGEAQPHWVLERRRTGNNGIEQVVGRTRIENNMI